MQHAVIQQWLRKKAAADAATGVLFSIGCLLLGGLVLVITFFFTYAVVWFGFNAGVSGFSELFFGRRLHLTHAGIVAVSLSFVALLFWANQRISREYLGTLPRRNYPGPGAGWIGLPGALISLLAYPGASTRMIADLLLTGPRLVAIAWSNTTKSTRLCRLDVAACSRVLAVLLRKAGRVSFAELTMTAELSNPFQVFRQLRSLDGVVFLKEEPAGLSLTSELRRELADVLGPSAQVEPLASGEPEPINLPTGTIYHLLGVPPAASPEEIEVAYRNWMTQSCARQTAKVDSAARQQQLDEQVEAVNRAYEAFLAAHESDQAKDDAANIQNLWEQFKGAERSSSPQSAKPHEQS